jgi:threonine dehydratase
MGLTEYLMNCNSTIKLIGCEAFNYPTYATFTHQRQKTIADGLVLETPHPKVQQRIQDVGVSIFLIRENEIRKALAGLYAKQGLIVEPSSAVTAALIQTNHVDLEEPICLVFTGENITRPDFLGLIDGY